MSAAATAFVLQRERDALDVVRELNALLADTLDLSVLLPRLLSGIQQHFGVDHATVLVARDGALEVAAAIGVNAERLHQQVPFGFGIVGIAAARRRTINIGNMRANRRYMGAMTGGRAVATGGLPALPHSDSQVAVPLLIGDELVGVLLAESLESAVFSAEDAELFSVMTGPIAGAIRNANVLAALEAANRDERAARMETERALQELQATQSALVQSEKLAGLGQLAAGIAHEVNTPLGAILASSGPLKEVTRVVRMLLDRREALDNEAWAALLAAVETPRLDLGIGSPETEEALLALESHFEDLGIPQADDLADMLVEAGLSLDVPALTDLLEADIEPIDLRVLYRVRSLGDAVHTIEQAGHKASKVIRALKAYSHRPSSQDERQLVSLRESVMTVLTMYQNVLKHGIDVQVNVESDEPVLANPEQLMQVWTNIVHNACDAMGDRGRLHIDIGGAGDARQVCVANDGPPIPEHIQRRLFEAFYTTKPMGQGTGLGLHLCSEIITAHDGRIEVASDPEWTRFTVHLPGAAVPALASSAEPSAST